MLPLSWTGLVCFYDMEDEDLDTYNRTPVHDSLVDFDYYENIDELSDIFDYTSSDYYINNLND